jgi:hypothetical protein
MFEFDSVQGSLLVARDDVLIEVVDALRQQFR